MTPTEARALAQIFEGYHVGTALRSLADQVEALQKSESAIRASERERCAKVCDKFLAANTCAQVIRELGDE